ncbi:MAG: hypothetical protein MZV63_27115 [Marinilabiliales bacterium]|nr:hypothetical protein [Marinilabiliales bacterium]
MACGLSPIASRPIRDDAPLSARLNWDVRVRGSNVGIRRDRPLGGPHLERLLHSQSERSALAAWPVLGGRLLRLRANSPT